MESQGNMWALQVLHDIRSKNPRGSMGEDRATVELRKRHTVSKTPQNLTELLYQSARAAFYDIRTAERLNEEPRNAVIQLSENLTDGISSQYLARPIDNELLPMKLGTIVKSGSNYYRVTGFVQKVDKITLIIEDYQPTGEPPKRAQIIHSLYNAENEAAATWAAWNKESA